MLLVDFNLPEQEELLEPAGPFRHICFHPQIDLIQKQFSWLKARLQEKEQIV